MLREEPNSRWADVLDSLKNAIWKKFEFSSLTMLSQVWSRRSKWASSSYRKRSRGAIWIWLSSLRACLKSRMRGHVIVGVMTISTDVDKLYDTDLSDAAWTLIAPMLPAARPGGRPRKINIRAVLNAIFYLLRTGCQWRFLPQQFPGWSPVYHYFQAWKDP